MKQWEATLTNGEVVKSDIAGEWRKLVTKCKESDLKISSLKYDGKETDERAISYFVIHSAFSLMLSKITSMRIGLGSFRANGKCRIRWFNVEGQEIYTDHSQVIRPEKAEMYKPLTIEAERK